MEYITLSNGVKMPLLGYGVYQIKGDECANCVSNAIDVGYRLIDTAQEYGNEKNVGDGIKKNGIDRKELFLTTKVWVDRYGYEKTIESVKESLENLQTDYLDLVILHQAFGDYYSAYRGLEYLYEEGLVKAIGVSNFYPDRLIDMCTFSKITPMVNQIEINPYHQRELSLKWNRKYNVALEAWAPFGEGRNGLFTNETILEIAKAHNKSAAQVMLRWLTQQNIVVIPKSTHVERMEENLNVFDFKLTDDEMAAIKALDKKQSAFFSHYDPDTVQFFMDYITGKI